MAKAGFVYCLTNPCFPGGVKIGMTQYSPWMRAAQLQTTGIPKPFKVECCKHVDNARAEERLLQSLFSESCVSRGREWFSVRPVDVYRQMINSQASMVMAQEYLIQQYEDEFIFSAEQIQERKELAEAEAKAQMEREFFEFVERQPKPGEKTALQKIRDLLSRGNDEKG